MCLAPRLLARKAGLPAWLLVLALARPASAANVTWTNAAGGNWNVASNWNSGAGPVPGTTDSARFSITGTYTVNINANVAVAKITAINSLGHVTLDCTGHSIAFNHASGLGKGVTLNLTNSTLAGSGIDGTFENLALIVVKDTCHFNCPLVIESTSTIRVLGTSATGSALFVSQAFTNKGLLELNDDGTGGVSTLDVSTGTLTNSASGELRTDQVASGQQRNIIAAVNNQGLFTVNAATTVGIASGVQTNSGTINMGANGSLLYSLTGAGARLTNTSAANVSLAAGTSFIVSGPGPYAHDGTFSVSGSGAAPQMTFNGTSVTLNGALNPAYDLYAYNTSVNGPAALTVPAGRTFTTVLLDTIACPMTVQGNLRVLGNLLLNGALTTAPADSVLVEGTLTSASSISAFGATVIGSLGSGGSAALTIASGPFMNMSTGRLMTTPNGPVGSLALNAPLENLGTMTVNHPLSVSSPGAAHSNSGWISVLHGNLTVPGASAFDNTGELQVDLGLTATFGCDSLHNLPGGVIRGRGTISVPSGKVTNEGTISPGNDSGNFEAVLTLAANFAQYAQGIVWLDFFGTTPGTNADQLVITGAARLGGVLHFDPYCGYAPTAGDTYLPMTWASSTLDFARVDGLDMGSGLSWTRTMEPTDLRITAHGTLVDTAPTGKPDTFYCAPNSSAEFCPVCNDADAEGNRISIANFDVTGTIGQAYVIFPNYTSFEYISQNSSYVDHVAYVPVDCFGMAGPVVQVTIIVGTVPAGVGPAAGRQVFSLGRPSPNPSRGAVRIPFTWSGAAPARFALYDLGGRLVRQASLPGGASAPREFVWDGRDDSGRNTPAGVYLCRLAATGADGRPLSREARVLRLR